MCNICVKTYGKDLGFLRSIDRSIREREAKYHADVDAKQQEQLAGGNLWEAVAALIDLHGDGDAVNKPASAGSTGSRHSLSPKGRADAAHHQLPVSNNKSKQESAKSQRQRDLPKPAKKSTDLSRMREVILIFNPRSHRFFLSLEFFTFDSTRAKATQFLGRSLRAHSCPKQLLSFRLLFTL